VGIFPETDKNRPSERFVPTGTFPADAKNRPNRRSERFSTTVDFSEAAKNRPKMSRWLAQDLPLLSRFANSSTVKLQPH
jgi:hypothetical protein